MKPRVYIDTSVIGGCFDVEFSVNFQRKARAELSKRYLEDRESFLKELTQKYGKLKKNDGGYKLQKKTA